MGFRQALFFSSPFMLAGIVHFIVIRFDLFPRLAAIPLDAGLVVFERRLFGHHKTLRGALTITISMAVFVTAEVQLFSGSQLISIYPKGLNPFVWGGLLGIAWVVGELPNSFLKRQLGFAPGQLPQGCTKPVLWLVDQLDGLIGVLVLTSLVQFPPPTVVFWLFAITLVIHPTGEFLMKLLGSSN
jgi:hypothetical protein